MSATKLMGDVMDMLATGWVKVVDYTGVLGPETPIIQLPPDFVKRTPKVEIH